MQSRRKICIWMDIIYFLQKSCAAMVLHNNTDDFSIFFFFKSCSSFTWFQLGVTKIASNEIKNSRQSISAYTISTLARSISHLYYTRVSQNFLYILCFCNIWCHFSKCFQKKNDAKMIFNHHWITALQKLKPFSSSGAGTEAKSAEYRVQKSLNVKGAHKD